MADLYKVMLAENKLIASEQVQLKQKMLEALTEEEQKKVIEYRTLVKPPLRGKKNRGGRKKQMMKIKDALKKVGAVVKARNAN